MPGRTRELHHRRELVLPSPRHVESHNPKCDCVPCGDRNPRILEEPESLMLTQEILFVNELVFRTLIFSI